MSLLDLALVPLVWSALSAHVLGAALGFCFLVSAEEGGSLSSFIESILGNSIIDNGGRFCRICRDRKETGPRMIIA